MNTYRTAMTLIGLMVAATAVSSAAVTVDNVSLKKQGEFTELTIYASGPLEFKHQIVEPGAGKPYRVVVDLDNAIHRLPHYNFNDLPSETITSIRTSQFSVDPDVVRVVLDMDGKVTYKVRREAGGITLVVVTPNDPEFPFWCAQPLSEAEKIELALGVGPKSSGDDSRPEKAESAGKVLVSNSVSGTGNSAPKISLPAQTADEKVSTSEGSEETAAVAVFSKEATKASETTSHISDAETSQHERSKLATAILSNLPSPELESQSSANTASARKTPGGGEAVEPPKATSSATGPIVKKTGRGGDPAPPFLVSGDEDGVSHESNEPRKAESAPQPKIISDNRGTAPANSALDSAHSPGIIEPAVDRALDSSSREGAPGLPKTSPSEDEDDSDEGSFQENPDRPTRTSGTLADRFPKRKVIEYQSWGRRDPFAQLVDKSLSGYDPGEIPNVETLRLVGVLRSVEGSSALLEDFDGYGYILKDGDPVLNGYVVQIGDDKIIFQIQEYGWSRTVALRLETD